MSGAALPGTALVDPTALPPAPLIRTWPDLETAVMNWLPTVLVGPEGAEVGFGTTLSFEDGGLYVRVTVIDAPNDGLTQQVVMDVDTFAPSRQVSYDLGKQVCYLLENARRIDGVLVDRLLTVSGPKRVPWDNSNTRRHLSRFRISTRRQEGAPSW